MESIVRADNLDVGYNNKAVISDINIKALKGQLICLLGPNGAGKTTILRTLSGILAPVKGTVELERINIKSIKQSEIAKKISIVLTDSVSPALTTVNELVAMGRMPYTGFMGRLNEDDRRIIAEALETVGAQSIKDRFYNHLSDGEKQKVMIARALVQEPELIILDEPTSHLDIKHKIEVIRVLQKLANEKNITCIISLHDIDLALKGCQTLLLVNDGGVVAQGVPEEIISSGSIRQLYNISGAGYNELLGSVELVGCKRNDVFVTGGNSSGINIYRALSRNGYGITAGILHLNDTDFQVADTICFHTVSEKPFEPISDESIEKCIEYIENAKCIIDTGFPVGNGNIGNINLLMRALNMGKPLLSIRKQSEYENYFGETSKRVIHCGSISELIAYVDTIFNNNK